MTSTTDPLEASEMLKSATIYRNSEFSYIYVCYHCASSFTNIEDTLNHVESHFDEKEYIVDLGCSETSTYIVREANTKTESNLLETMMGDDNAPVHIKLEYEIDERKTHQDTKTDLSAFTNEYYSQCTLCGQMLDSAPLLIVHMMRHNSNVTTLTCPECSQNCKNETTLLGHLHQHMATNDTTYDALIEKMISKYEAGGEVREEVPVKIESEERPRKRYIKKPLKTCDICSLTFSTKKKILSHLRQAHVTKPEVKKIFFDCEKCKRKIEGKFAFYAHQYGHQTYDDRVGVLDDEILQKNLRKYLDENINCDVSPKTFGCKLCGTVHLKNRYYVARHILQRHIYLMKINLTDEKLFCCEYCGRKFAHSNNLTIHKRIHTLEKPYTCSICNKSFSQSSYMKYHKQIHTELQSQQCPTCGQTFKTHLRYKSHLRTHVNALTKCPICNKELKSYRLRNHIRDVHESDHRPHKCSVCSEAFKTVKTLKTHLLRHSDERKYECRFKCKQTFISASGRRAHERTKHKNETQ